MPNAFPAQTNATRFFFQQINISSPGTAPVYDVMDGGGSLNSAGFVGSCSSSKKVGKIQYDFVMARWSFFLQVKGDPITGSDATLISNFIATLATPTTPSNPLVQ